MIAVKAYQAAAFVKAPDPKITAILFYGPDAGMVLERARTVAQILAARDEPPGEIIRIGDSDLETDPDRLAVELQTIPMFGGRQVVRVSSSRRVNAPALQPLIESDTPGGYLVVEAGNLKPADGLRKLFEKSPHGAAVACYGDEARDLDAMITEVLNAAKIDISRDARTLLAARLGADRALSRGEVEKLALYAMDKGTVEPADIDAVVGDASELAMDKIILAAASGNAAAAVSECDRAVSSGLAAQAIILAAQRHFQRLHRAQSAMDAGRSLDDALRQLRPPVHFKQKAQFTAQLRSWSVAKLDRAMTRIAASARDARLNAALDATLTERLLLELARLANAAGGAGRR